MLVFCKFQGIFFMREKRMSVVKLFECAINSYTTLPHTLTLGFASKPNSLTKKSDGASK